MKKFRVVFFLYLLPVVVAGLQIYFSQFSTLSPWKGGGFGMYTAQHPDDRGIFLEYQNDTAVIYRRIYPFPNGKPDSSLAGLEFLYPFLPQLLVFPSSVDVSGPDWKTVRLWAERKGRKCATSQKIFFHITEPTWNLKNQTFTTKTLFRREL